MLLFVTVPTYGLRSIAFEGRFERHEPGALAYDTVVGFLDREVSDQASLDAAAAELGHPVGWLSAEVMCREGHVAALLTPSIRCATIEEAKALPGFMHLYEYTGEHPAAESALG